ncbi:MAG: glucose 1-dehydrogenase [Anaerolineaceae bacterium]|nr:MAG: glucose 1-dehydrogenase [Anaerolineaceae bacterium]
MPATNFDLNGKVALVTGASRGIGLAIAQAYALAGAKVVLSSRKQEGLDKAADQIRAIGGEVMPLAAHTGSSDAVKTVVDQAVHVWGGIDIVVNNAATNPHFGHIMTAEESHWDKILDVNVKGYFRVVKACVPIMKERGGGSVINMASVAGKEPQPMMGVYSVSKAAVIMLTEVLAAELAQDNIRVNAIAPGFVKTSFSRALWQNEGIYNAVVKAIPQRRMAEPDEIAGMALYLASGAAQFTTGGTFVVDGGQLVGGSYSLF